MSFTHHDVPDKAILAANAIHAFSGFFNFVVFCATRPAMVFGIRPNRGIPNLNPNLILPQNVNSVVDARPL